jgi:glutamyl-tRNA(Gln) amidotransferase subunit D
MTEFEVGDYVELITNKDTFRGLVMPSNIFSEHDIIRLKLDNGYNIGVKISKLVKVKVLQKGEKKEKRLDTKKIQFKDNYISILGTGGTIASYIDYKTGAVHPAETQEELLISVPELSEKHRINSRIIFSILSEDMKVSYWQTLAKEIVSEFNRGAKGVIIPHGTDTMAYTAAALAFIIPDLAGPVSLVGAQRSSDRPSSDAYQNLLNTEALMDTNLGEVVVTMHESISDNYSVIHRGVRVRKMHTSRRDAFKSINGTPIAKIKNGNVEFLKEYKQKVEGKIKVAEKMNDKVSILYYYPGLEVDHLKIIGDHVDGIIIMGTGLGHVGTYLIDTVRELTDSGKLIAMTSQCLFGAVNMNVYSSGRELIKAGVIPLGDMLPETAFVKMMWLLGNYSKEKARLLMPKNLRFELSEKRVLW